MAVDWLNNGTDLASIPSGAFVATSLSCHVLELARWTRLRDDVGARALVAYRTDVHAIALCIQAFRAEIASSAWLGGQYGASRRACEAW